MELLLSIAIVALAALGLGVGLLLGRGPVQTSCGGLSCGKGAACAACPNRREPEGQQ